MTENSSLSSRKLDRATLFAGGIMLLVGAFVIYQSLGMRLGTATRMGPGYYPLMIGIGSMSLGGLICLLEARQVVEADETLTDRGWPAWRSRLMVPFSMIVFALLLRPAGLLPASVGLVCVASLAAPPPSITRIIALSIGTPILLWVIFILGLNLPVKIFGDVL